MFETPMARRGMASTPHHLASSAALAVLREGGNAIEAAIAAASTLAVVHPQVNGLGGDGFWLIAEPGKPPVSIDGSGASGAKVDAGLYPKGIPATGPMAAGTVAGAVSGWQLALDVSRQWGGNLPLERLFADAVHCARDGYAVTTAQSQASAAALAALKKAPGFAPLFLARNKAPQAGAVQTNSCLADTLEKLASRGLDDFYRGEVARMVAEDLKAAGSPLQSDDLARHRGMRRRPLSLGVPAGTLFNTAPPTQGLASLIMLGVLQRLQVSEPGGFPWVHALIEAARQAQGVREAHLADPHRMSVHATTYLSEPLLDRMAGDVDMNRASPLPGFSEDGEAVWFGVIDGQGRAVSVVQSLYGPFGSQVALPNTGILWHNRVAAFSLDPDHRNALEPRRKPMHSLTPALARLKDGRTMVWGASRAQPQIQAQIFSRIVGFGETPQAAVAAPRFAMTDGVIADESLGGAVIDALSQAGHSVRTVPGGDAALGWAGALIRHGDGTIAGAANPNGDGSVAAY